MRRSSAGSKTPTTTGSPTTATTSSARTSSATPRSSIHRWRRRPCEAEDGVIPPGHYRAVTTGGELITPAFAGLGNAKGTWTLRVRDLCDDDTGSVSAAALFLTTDGVAPADSNPPDTDITTSPANGIAKTLKVPFAFTSDETGVTYQCALDAAAYALCANPATITVKSGKHTLAVRARDAAGNLDPFPARPPSPPTTARASTPTSPR